MNDEDPSLRVDILAAGLRGDQKESGSTVEFLAKKFEMILPNQTKIVRGGWILSSDKPVRELTVSFDDFQYQLTVEKHGAVNAKESKLVRGVVLKSREIKLDEWINLVAESLSKYAEKNASARQALSDFLIGG
jgi:hypothetical protein